MPFVTLLLGAVNAAVLLVNALVLYILLGSNRHGRRPRILPSKWIVASMAFSDLLLGFFVLPFIILQEHLLWVFGEFGCRIWIALDTFLINASIYNMLAISLDRYMAIARPLHYRSFSNRLTRGAISCAWGLSLAVALSPSVVAVPFASMTAIGRTGVAAPFNNGSVADVRHYALAKTRLDRTRFVGNCPGGGGGGTPSSSIVAQNESEHNADVYILISGLVTFILPMIAMVFLNALIMRAVYVSNMRLSHFDLSYKKAASHHRFPAHRAQQHTSTSGSTPTTIHNNNHADAHQHHRRPSIVRLLRSNQSEPAFSASPPLSQSRRNSSRPLERALVAAVAGTALLPTLAHRSSGGGDRSGGAGDGGGGRGLAGGGGSATVADAWFSVITCSLVPSGKDMIRNANRLLLIRRSEWRVVKTTGLVVGTFCFCWLPFTVVYVLQGLGTCPVGSCLDRWLFTAAFWLGFFNSALNPFIYAIFLGDFSRCVLELANLRRRRCPASGNGVMRKDNLLRRHLLLKENRSESIGSCSRVHQPPMQTLPQKDVQPTNDRRF